MNHLKPHRNPKAFTLIELLVVIAIIAMLLSIIVPAVSLAKKKAATAVCLINAKNLSLAWYTYQGENNGLLVIGDPGGLGDGLKGAWIENPQFLDPSGKERECDALSTVLVTDDHEKRGIMKGAIYPYLQATDVFHCPADNVRKSKYDLSRVFRTYSIPKCFKSGKFAQITQPGIRYNFIEEADGRNFNVGTWDIKTPADAPLYAWEWQDVVAINHGDSSVLGFCDGHAEIHKWVDDHTKLRVKMFIEDVNIKDTAALNAAYPRNKNLFFTDVDYMSRGWAYRVR
ncbi:MAG: type II secretion system GspH family protein [Planctomycetaceae bacterium]|nr:type II secretion system GspH family protein [Planctomycetaceae bacterium]